MWWCDDDYDDDDDKHNDDSPVVLLKQHDGQVVLSLQGGGVHLKHAHVAFAEVTVTSRQNCETSRAAKC